MSDNDHTDDDVADTQSISIEWSVGDVKTVRPDLTSDQCWEVLQYAKRSHDASIGMNWTVLEELADNYFPKAEE